MTLSALIIGATGQTGRVLLKDLLSSPDFTRVSEYGRRTTALDNLPNKEKLEQKVIDFENLQDSGLGEGKWDVVFITLGTTKALAGSAAAFEKIDREYVINAAKAAKSPDPSTSQRLVYLSSSGASASSPLLYPKSKGLTELGLAGLGYKETIVFRPAMLKGANREDSRIGETVFGAITGVLSCVSKSVEIQIPILAKSMLIAGKLGTAGLPEAAEAKSEGKEGAIFTVVNNSGAMGLASTEGRLEFSKL